MMNIVVAESKSGALKSAFNSFIVLKRNENATETTKKRKRKQTKQNENLRRRVLAEILAKICAAVCWPKFWLTVTAGPKDFF